MGDNFLKGDIQPTLGLGLGLLVIIQFQSTLAGSGETSMPFGHLKPLGAHTQPGMVEERWDVPDAKEFWEKYVKPSKPVVFRGAAKTSGIFEKWTPEYVKKNFAELEVRIEAKTEKEGYVPVGAAGLGRDTIGNFFDTIHETNKYVVSEVPVQMYDDVSVLPCMTCGPFKTRMVEVDLWMSGGGTSSILHKDAFNAMNCLYNGTKEWKLIEYIYEDKIYKSWEPGSPLGGFSKINVERVDLLKYPKVKEVPWSYTTVNAGDCLFLPKSMYHQVKSYGKMNTAVALLFSRFEYDKPKTMNFSECDKTKQDFTPLSKFDVDWQWPGKGIMTMGYPELFQMRLQLLGALKHGNKDLEVFLKESAATGDGSKQSPEEKAKAIMEILREGNITGEIDRRVIRKLTKDQLRRITLIHDPLIPSNLYEYEYYQIAPSELGRVLSILSKHDGIVKRDKFVKLYKDNLGGTHKFADKFFDDLAGEGIESISKEDVKKNFWSAAKKYDIEEKDGGISLDDSSNEDNDDGDAYIGVDRNLDGDEDEELSSELSRQMGKEKKGEGMSRQEEEDDSDEIDRRGADELEDGDDEETEGKKDDGDKEMAEDSEEQTNSQTPERDEL